jgi:methylmalonyl-CoA/ethylmalonyl-CoA epimerase
MERRRMLKYAHHVHYIVSDLEGMIAYMDETFGMKPDSVEEYDEYGGGIKEALYWVDKTLLDIIEPTNPDSNLGKFLRENGPGMLHVAWAIDDIEKAARDLAAKGTKFTGEAAITESVRGYREINIDRSVSHGIWFQLCEELEQAKRK